MRKILENIESVEYFEIFDTFDSFGGGETIRFPDANLRNPILPWDPPVLQMNASGRHASLFRLFVRCSQPIHRLADGRQLCRACFHTAGFLFKKIAIQRVLPIVDHIVHVSIASSLLFDWIRICYDFRQMEL